MEIKGDITILVNESGATIELRDRNANITFARVNLTSEQLCKALSRRANVIVDAKVYGLDKVGKKHENKTFEFKLPKDFNRVYGDDKQRIQDLQLSEICQEELDKLNEGWISESYFNSQNSFFTKDNEKYARVTIRRWT